MSSQNNLLNPDDDLISTAKTWREKLEDICQIFEKSFTDKSGITNLTIMEDILGEENFQKYLKFRRIARQLKAFEGGELIK